jgi:hypothetical protein
LEHPKTFILKNEKLTIQRYLKTFRDFFDYSVKKGSLLNTGAQ